MSGPSLRIRPNRIGRGVYAGRDFARGEIIESAPVLVFRGQDARGILAQYRWKWGSRYAIPLGTMSFSNHSRTPNATSRLLYTARRIVFRALRPIDRGEEIRINYQTPWFREL